MSELKDKFIAYRVGRGFDMRLEAATSNRDWMDQTNSSFAN